MKISYQWLRQFVDVPVEARKLADDLSMAGLPVESIEAHDDDFLIELELTANRGDCLSHWGVAREAATIYQLPLKAPQIAFQETNPPVNESATVEISDPDLCYRYCARVVKGVTVAPSPSWLVRQLEAVGQRSVNNIADITNYVLFELGHPLHAFDLDRLTGRKIIVRRAKTGEHLTTLDGVDRTLSTENLVIADAARPVALAGVMGGAESEISTLTHNVLIESAWFLPTSIRKTARTFGMHTEASHRFERGTDIENVVTAMNRCAQLIQEVSGGSIQRGFIDCHPTAVTPPELVLRKAELRRHLGIDVDSEQVDRILSSLCFKPVVTQSEGKTWHTPTWRNDVTREIDLIEEVARHYGYNKFPPRLLRTSTLGQNLPAAAPISRLKEHLAALGYFEIIAFPFLDVEEAARFTRRIPVELANPLSEVAGALRPTALPSLLEMVRRNLNRGQRDVRVYEVGKIYFRSEKRKVVERTVLVLGAAGDYRPKVLHEPQPEPYRFQHFKGDVEQALALFETPDRKFRKPENPFHTYRQEQSSDVFVDGNHVATFGLLDAALLERYKIRQNVFAAEIDLERLLARGLRRIDFRPLSPFPAVERDLSFVLSGDVSFEQVLKTISAVEVENSIEIRPIDTYQDSSLGKGNYSLSLRFVFQSPDRTLVEQEVAPQIEKVMHALETELGARIRKET
ncbi:MAG: phenylalanine--tRNA ligase subunit beta [Acidobacteriia bacterium]|nr:phenylalanine--tRNA ligase subunit beta [Terriglobia bacterium]